MASTFNFKDVPEPQRVAYYGAMFAMASSDGQMDRDEIALVFETLDLEGFSEDARAVLRSYLVDPPAIEACQDVLACGCPELRFGVMVALIDVAFVDGVVDPKEQQALQAAQRRLGINDAQMKAMEAFAREAKRIRDRGLDDASPLSPSRRPAPG